MASFVNACMENGLAFFLNGMEFIVGLGRVQLLQKFRKVRAEPLTSYTCAGIVVLVRCSKAVHASWGFRRPVSEPATVGTGRPGRAIVSSSESSGSILRKYHHLEHAVDGWILLLISLEIIFRKSL